MMKSPDAPHWDVFVSHNRVNKDWVRDTVGSWRALGLRVFFDEDSVEPGDDIVSAIGRAITSARVVVLVLSPSSLNSRWVAFELSMAAFHDVDTASRKIIPVVLEPIDREQLPPALKRLNHIDLSSPPDYPRGYARLLQALGIKVSIDTVSSPAFVPSPVRNESHLRQLGFLSLAAMGTKGGAGKTTFLLAAAELIASTGKSVLIVDADIQDAGMTRYVRKDATSTPAVWTVLDTAFAAHTVGNTDQDRDLGAWEVTPAYLRRKQPAGRIFLIPSRQEHDARVAFNALADVHPDSRRNEVALGIVRDLVERGRHLPTPVDAVMIDCGAADNPLVSSGIVSAEFGYIVSSPHSEFATAIDDAERRHRERYPSVHKKPMTVVVNQATKGAQTQWGIRPGVFFVHEDEVFRREAAEGRRDPEGVGLSNLYLDVLRVLQSTLSSRYQHLLPDPVEVWVKPYLRGMREFATVSLRAPRYRYLFHYTTAVVALCGALGVLAATNAYQAIRSPSPIVRAISKPPDLDDQAFNSQLNAVRLPPDLKDRIFLEGSRLIILSFVSSADEEAIAHAMPSSELRDSVVKELQAVESQQIIAPALWTVATLAPLFVAVLALARFLNMRRRKLLLQRLVAISSIGDDKELTRFVESLMKSEAQDKTLHWLRDSYRAWLSFRALAIRQSDIT
jgi:cellulose biosynthesis protein BcsQ